MKRKFAVLAAVLTATALLGGCRQKAQESETQTQTQVIETETQTETGTRKGKKLPDRKGCGQRDRTHQTLCYHA